MAKVGHSGNLYIVPPGSGGDGIIGSSNTQRPATPAASRWWAPSTGGWVCQSAYQARRVVSFEASCMNLANHDAEPLKSPSPPSWTPDKGWGFSGLQYLRVPGGASFPSLTINHWRYGVLVAYSDAIVSGSIIGGRTSSLSHVFNMTPVSQINTMAFDYGGSAPPRRAADVLPARSSGVIGMLGVAASDGSGDLSLWMYHNGLYLGTVGVPYHGNVDRDIELAIGASWDAIGASDHFTGRIRAAALYHMINAAQMVEVSERMRYL